MIKKGKLVLSLGLSLFSLWSFAQGNTSKLIPADCGINDVHFQQTLTAEQVQGATKYEFRLRNSDLTYSETLQKNTPHFQLNQLAVQPQDKETYDVDVRVKQGSNFGAWGQVCQIQANDHPNTELIIPDCGRQNVKDGDMLTAKAIAGAIEYEFSVTSKATGQSYSIIEQDKDFSLDQLPIPLNAGTQLAIKVRTSKGNGFGAWGKECAIQILDLGTTKLIPAHCSKTQVLENEPLIFSAVPLANQYRVVAFVDSIIDTISITGNSFRIADFPDLPYLGGHLYSFQIQAINNTITGEFGALCTVSSALPPATPNCANLIVNPSFEYTNYLPTTTGEADLPLAWDFLNLNQTNPTPDYFHRNSTNSDVQVPSNIFNTNPLETRTTGDAYVGEFMQSNNNVGEYIYQELALPLQQGKLYYAGIYLANSDKNGFNNSTDDINLFFTDALPVNFSSFTGTNPPDRITAQGQVTSETWVNLSGLFTPSVSNLSHIIIGSKSQCCGGSLQPYYFFDDVMLRELSIYDNLTVCQGGTVDLASAFPCAVPPGLQFRWKNCLTGAVVANSLSFTPNTPLAKCYELETSDDGSTWFSMGQVSITELPVPDLEIVSSSGVPNVCYGETIELCAVSNGNPVNVTWQFPNGVTVSGLNCVQRTQTGIYSATYTSPFGCPVTATFEVEPCCVDDGKGAVVLGDAINTITYSPSGTQLPNIGVGATVYIEGNIIIEGYGKFLFDNVEFIVRGSLDGNGIVDGSYMTFRTTDVEMVNCKFSSVCDIMWGGIVLENQSSLFMKGGIVQDAFEAVQYRDHEVKYTLEGVNFLNNHRGLVTGLSDAATFSALVEGCTFTSTPKDMKIPFENQYSDAHIAVLNYVSTSVRTAIENNTFENCAYGVFIDDEFDPHLFFTGCHFENCFIGGIYNATPFINSFGTLGSMRVRSCTLNVPTSAPATAQFPAGTIPVGIRVGHKYQAELLDNIFISTGYEANGARIETQGADITANDNYFSGFNEALSMQPYAYRQMVPTTTGFRLNETFPMLTIEGNTFEGNYVNMRFLSNANLVNLLNQAPNCPTGCPQSVPENMTIEMHCNEFIAIDPPLGLPNGAGTGLLVDANTEMNDIGDCANDNPAGNGFPNTGGNNPQPGPVSGWSSPTGWISINDAGNSFSWEYQPYQNEFVGNTNGITSPLSLTGFNSLGQPLVCNGKDALDQQTGVNCQSLNIYFPPLRPENGNDIDVTGLKESRTINSLGDAFPNPAHTSVTIPYQVKVMFESAQIEILDLKSSETLLTINLNNRDGEAVFITDEFKQGMYLYRLVVDGIPVSTKSIVIMK